MTSTASDVKPRPGTARAPPANSVVNTVETERAPVDEFTTFLTE
jgi:hypothetical protein